MIIKYYLFLSLAFLLSLSCNNDSSSKKTPTISKYHSAVKLDTFNLKYEILNIIPHKEERFTQGLEFYKGQLYESSGLYGKSVIKVINFKSGEVVNKGSFPKKNFAEGCTFFNDKLYVLTWKAKKVFVFDPNTLNILYSIPLKINQCWGLSHNDEHLIMSDGSEKIYFLDPKKLSKEKIIHVSLNGKKVEEINELEWVEGFIYANIWFKDIIYKINPKNGKVVGAIKLKDILKNYTGKSKTSLEDVLNGIAWNENTKTFYVTGKNWPFLFEMKLL